MVRAGGDREAFRADPLCASNVPRRVANHKNFIAAQLAFEVIAAPQVCHHRQLISVFVVIAESAGLRIEAMPQAVTP